MAKTMKKIAEELGVDKQRVYRYAKQHGIDALDVEGDGQTQYSVKYYDEEAEALIRQGIAAQKPSPRRKKQPLRLEPVAPNTSESDAVKALIKELDAKNEQIRELNLRLAEVSAALVAAQKTAQSAQALHAGTIQQQLASGDKRSSGKSISERLRVLFSR